MICFSWQVLIGLIVFFILGLYSLVRFVVPWYLKRKMNKQMDNMMDSLTNES